MIARRTFLAGAALALATPAEAEMQEGLSAAAARDWEFLADTVMGGVSQGGARRVSEAGREVLHLSGDVSTENRGGFLQMRTELPGGLPEGARGLVLRVRGNGEGYFVHLRTRATVLPWQFWQAAFDTGPDWAEVRLSWEAFAPRGGLVLGALRPTAIRSVGLAAYGRDHRADLWLSDIGWV